MTMMGKSENFSPQEAAFFGQIFPCVKVYFNKGEIKFCFVLAAQTGGGGLIVGHINNRRSTELGICDKTG